MSADDIVRFGIASHLNISFHYVKESDYTKAEWAEMSEKERDAALTDWVWENVDAWVVEDDR